MEHFTLHDRNGTYEFTGLVLGAGTSEAANHNHDGEFVDTRDRRRKCSACRWQETTIYLTDIGEFVAHTRGRTRVPGEVDFSRVVSTDSGRELLDLLTVRSTGDPFIPAPAMRALAQAADQNRAVRDAYDNRAVV